MSTYTRFWFFVLLPAALAFTLSACGGDDDDDTVADDDDATGDCYLDGTWNLTEFHCDTYDISADWFAVMDSTVMEISPTADDCRLLLTNSSASCVEVMESVFTVDGDTIDGENLGIVSCTPDACTFTAQDEPCVVGDNAGPMGASTFELDGDTLTVSGFDPDGLCGHLEMRQIWQRQ